MRSISNNLLKKSALTACACVPGIIAEALESLSRGDAAPAFSASVRLDPVLALRMRALPADSTLVHPDLVRALLLAAPVAADDDVAFATRWQRATTVARLAEGAAPHCGLDPAAAWLAGASHVLAEYEPLARSGAEWPAEIDPEGWIADAARFHAEPLARGRAAHPLVRVVQLAYQLVTRADAAASIDVRAALSGLHLTAADAVALLADARQYADAEAARLGLAARGGASARSGFARLAQVYASEAARAALGAHFRRAASFEQGYPLMEIALRALFGAGHAVVFAPAADRNLRVLAGPRVPAALAQLAIPADDGSSVLSRAWSDDAPHAFNRESMDAALVDAQIARRLGCGEFVCQRITLGPGRAAVLVATEVDGAVAANGLWRAAIGEWQAAGAPRVAAAAVPAVAQIASVASPQAGIPQADPASEAIPRDRVRRAVHEVANPLTIMRNYVNLLSDRLGEDSVVQRDLGIIGDEIERVARIVRGITVVDEPVEAAEPLEPVSVNAVVSELVRMALGTLFVPNQVNVQIDLDPALPHVPLQKDLLKQVLVNLAKNAVEAMTGSGGQLAFTTRRGDANGRPCVEIEVADTGPGLPQAVASRLFEPVVSEKGGDHAGLGLAISRGLVERMNGELSCSSTSEGTRFLIRLPTRQQALETRRCGSM